MVTFKWQCYCSLWVWLMFLFAILHFPACLSGCLILCCTRILTLSRSQGVPSPAVCLVPSRNGLTLTISSALFSVQGASCLIRLHLLLGCENTGAGLRPPSRQNEPTELQTARQNDTWCSFAVVHFLPLKPSLREGRVIVDKSPALYWPEAFQRSCLTK